MAEITSTTACAQKEKAQQQELYFFIMADIMQILNFVKKHLHVKVTLILLVYPIM